MDKAYTKMIFERAGINQAEYIYIKANDAKYRIVSKNFDEEEVNLKKLANIVKEKLSFPVFVKPSNSGSSVGINRAENETELENAILEASKLDKKILIEKEIIGREVECAVLGNGDVKASCVGEILPAEKFYTFDAKYKNSSSRVIIPAELSNDISDKIRKTAIKAFKAVDGSGLSRVDFFVPKLWEEAGINYTELLDELVKLAL